MKVKLKKSCVIGVGKTGEKGKTVDVKDDVARQLIKGGFAEAVSKEDKKGK